MKAKREFFRISGTAEVPRQLKPKRQRWLVDDEIYHGTCYSLWISDQLQGRVERLRNWPDDVYLRAHRKTKIEDMPFFHFAPLPVVSGKLKEVIESIAPRHVQFLQIAGILFRGKKLDIGEYWCMNCLREIDCVDWKRSHADELGSGLYPHQRSVLDLAIKQDKLPSEVRIFVPSQANNWILCDAIMRDAILESGCTGVSFWGTLGQKRYEKFQ